MTMMMPAPGLSIRKAALADSAEAARIDAFVAACPRGTPFHRTAWSRAVELGCGQRPHYLFAESGDGNIAGVLPLTEIRSPLFGSALTSVGFAVDGGALALTEGVAEQLQSAAVDLARQSGCPTLEMRGGSPQNSGWSFNDATYVGFARDLADDDDAELMAIPRKQRAEVRRALGFELTVHTGSGSSEQEQHYAVYAESVRNLGTPVFPRSLFAAMIDHFGDAADILTICANGRPVASVLSFYHGGTVYPYWGGGTAEARGLRANDLMYYALMLHARKQKGCHRFDFGRSKVGTGPARFKQNWGFEPKPLGYSTCSLDGGPPRNVNPLSPKYRIQVAVWKKLPLWLANLAGPIVSRGLG